MIAMLFLLPSFARLAFSAQAPVTVREVFDLAERLNFAPGWTCEVGKTHTYCCRGDFDIVMDSRLGWVCRQRSDASVVMRPTRVKRFRGDTR